jgi:kojibiose phosphorylase
MYSGSIDLEDAKGNVRDGIHGAAAGGLWLATVFGFAGLKIEKENFTLTPNLPAHWKSMTFRICLGAKQHTIHLTASQE